MLFSSWLESMAQPCTDAKGRALKLGDRRWIIAQKHPYELLFVDARDDVMRLLALPLEGMEGEDCTIAGHQLKLVMAPVQQSKGLFAVNSKAKNMVEIVAAKGNPESIPAEVGLEDVEQFLAELLAQQQPAVRKTEFFTLNSPEKESEDTNVGMMAQILDLKEMVGKLAARQVEMERERKVPGIRDAPPGLSRGVRFADDDDDDDEAGILESLRAEVKQHATSRAEPPRRSPDPDDAANDVADFFKEMAPRDAALLKYVEARTRRPSRRADDEDLLHFPDEVTKASSGARGLAAKADVDEQFAVNPYAKYKHVVAIARHEVGVESQALLDDHIVVKRYFRDHVGMDKYKLATRMFEMVVDLHGSIKASDTKRALGRVATMYQFIEQYVVDKGDLYVASLATHMPEPDRYLAEPREEPIGKLMNRNVTAMAGAYQRDLDVLRKARDERAKK